MEIPSDKEYVNYLREEIKLAFYKSTGRKLQVTESKDNGYFELLTNDIIKRLDLKKNPQRQPPKVGTLIKLLCHEEFIDITPNYRIIFEDYISAVNDYYESKGTVSSRSTEILDKENFKGARVINLAFKEYLKELKNIVHTDFYSGKQNNFCQWYGIVKNWFCDRESYVEIKNRITICFEFENIVAVVILGAGGTGKSTLLRKLAIDLISVDFRILWIDDVDFFCSTDVVKIKHSSDKYLAFIDDWHLVEKNGLSSILLNRVSNLNNLKLVIADRNDANFRAYEKYLFISNKFELQHNENRTIVENIVKLNIEWETTFRKTMAGMNINSTPLYITLYILARSSKEIEFQNTHDTESIFRDIAIRDFKMISSMFPGLAKALYYWSCIYNDCHRYISWAAFLKIADHYNNNSVVSTELKLIRQDSLLHRILFHYISIRNSFEPVLNGLQTFSFHHDMLIEDGISKLKLTEWLPFDDNIKDEIGEIVFDQNDLYSFVELYSTSLMRQRGLKTIPNFSNDSVEKVFYEKAYNLELASVVVFHESKLLMLNLQFFELAKKDENIIKPLFRIIFHSEINNEGIKIILNNLIKRGYNFDPVIIAFDLLQKNKVEEVRQYFEQIADFYQIKLAFA